LGFVGPAVAIAVVVVALRVVGVGGSGGSACLFAGVALSPGCFVSAYFVESWFGRGEAPSFWASAVGFLALLGNGAALMGLWFCWAALFG
jgi:hypothetical protein